MRLLWRLWLLRWLLVLDREGVRALGRAHVLAKRGHAGALREERALPEWVGACHLWLQEPRLLRS